MKNNKNNKGFSLIELIITVSIAAILAGIGMPSLLSSVQGSRMSTSYNALLGALSFTRHSAITSGATVTLCKSNPQNNACGASSDSWANGWLIFRDNDSDGAIDSGEEILSINNDVPDSVKMVFTGIGNRISYNAEGFAKGYSGKVTFCDQQGNTAAKEMIISQNGRVRKADSQDTLASCL